MREGWVIHNPSMWWWQCVIWLSGNSQWDYHSSLDIPRLLTCTATKFNGCIVTTLHALKDFHLQCLCFNNWLTWWCSIHTPCGPPVHAINTWLIVVKCATTWLKPLWLCIQLTSTSMLSNWSTIYCVYSCSHCTTDHSEEPKACLLL